MSGTQQVTLFRLQSIFSALALHLVPRRMSAYALSPECNAIITDKNFSLAKGVTR
jgi:hypothetical protein